MSNTNSMQNQHPLSFFDRSFSDNPSDVLFCCLNEIEPVFLENESYLADEFVQIQTLDPRTNHPITQSLFDYTVTWKPELFDSANRSLLTKKEHSTCVAFLQSVKAGKQIFPHQVQCFAATSAKRQREKEAFLKFLLQYNDANYEKLYGPGLILVDSYQRFYERKTQQMMEKHKDGIFQIHTGFPMPRLCGNSEMSGTVNDVKVVNSWGTPCVINLDADLSKMKPKIETYLDMCNLGESEDNSRLNVDEQILFDISMDAIVFLLCAGEHIDLPTEVVVEIAEDDGGHIVILINDPLPSRNIGTHTAELVATKCMEEFLGFKENKPTQEIQANGVNIPFALKTIERFLNTTKPQTSSTPACNAFDLIKWNLCLEKDEEKQIAIVSRTRKANSSDQERKQVLSSLKLEYKPQFGCEIPSKVCLIREWFEQRLSTTPHTQTHRHRINASNFKTVLHEHLSLEDIEQELERHYQIKMPRLLGSLADFLNLLAKVSAGRYLLRFNPRFQEKLMLYSETKLASSKTFVTLHALLREKCSELAFMTSRQLVPIDDSLCSAMHDFYQLIPCAFPPWRPKGVQNIIDDRDFILKKVQENKNKLAAKTSQYTQRRNKVKRSKRAQKLKLKKQQKAEEQKNEQELENDINHDRLLYGFDPN